MPILSKKTEAQRGEVACLRPLLLSLVLPGTPWPHYTYPLVGFCWAPYHRLLLPGLGWGQREAGSHSSTDLAPQGESAWTGGEGGRRRATPPTSGASLLVAWTSWLWHCCGGSRGLGV